MNVLDELQRELDECDSQITAAEDAYDEEIGDVRALNRLMLRRGEIVRAIDRAKIQAKQL